MLMLVNKALEEGREKEVLLGLKDLDENSQIGEVEGWEHPYLWNLYPEKVCKIILIFLN
jgi:hypothetical protein